jgi:hypothetical protein
MTYIAITENASVSAGPLHITGELIISDELNGKISGLKFRIAFSF